MRSLEPVLQKLTNLFPLWIFLAAVVALTHPPIFAWFRGPLITGGLGMIMLGMGLTMNTNDFRRVTERPFPIFLGVIFQYLIMPTAGYLSASFFKLDTPLAAGLILVACCPGGTASNVISFLAKADVPLSVTMTTISTFIAVIMTPLLTSFLIGNRIHVDVAGLFWSTVQVVLLPVALGVVANTYGKKWTTRVLPAAPLIAVIFIVLIVGSIVASGREAILKAGFSLIGAVFTLHALGFFFGYLFTKLITKKEMEARTISIEVGMQNSGLGVVLAKSNFANPLVAIPSAISSVFHSLIGSCVAAWWRRNRV